MTTLSKFSEHLQIAVMTFSGTLSINIFCSFGLGFAKVCKYGRLPLMCFDMLTMLSMFHMRNLFLSREDVCCHAHILRRKLVTINE